MLPALPFLEGRLVGLNKELVESAQVLCCANIHLVVRAYKVAEGRREEPAYPEGIKVIEFPIGGWRHVRNVHMLTFQHKHD